MKWASIKKKLAKPKFFFGIPLAFFSFQIYLGAVLGYFLTKFLATKVPSIIFDIGDWRFHFHHWLIALGVLLSAFYYSFLPFPSFSFGFIGGIIFQGVSCYSDWYKILFRKNSNQK